jgi:hypothetical protein
VSPLVTTLVAAALVLVAFVLWRIIRRRRSSLDSRLNRAAHSVLSRFVVPDHDGDEILVEYALLSGQGILVLEIKHVDGNVFGGDRLDEWTVIAAERRYTFANPRVGLRDRVAALQEIVSSVPVEGFVVFTGETEFPKGRPSDVILLEELLDTLASDRDSVVRPVIESFLPHWQQLCAVARNL